MIYVFTWSIQIALLILFSFVISKLLTKKAIPVKTWMIATPLLALNFCTNFIFHALFEEVCNTPIPIEIPDLHSRLSWYSVPWQDGCGPTCVDALSSYPIDSVFIGEPGKASPVAREHQPRELYIALFPLGSKECEDLNNQTPHGSTVIGNKCTGIESTGFDNSRMIWKTNIEEKHFYLIYYEILNTKIYDDRGNILIYNNAIRRENAFTLLDKILHSGSGWPIEICQRNGQFRYPELTKGKNRKTN